MRRTTVHKPRSERLDDYKTNCTRCGRRMSHNHRVVTEGVTPLCTDCRESDRGLAFLWRKKS